MGLFDGVNTATTPIKEEVDRIKGQKKEPLPSDIYNLMIKYAYGQKSKGGAMGVHLVLTTPDETEIKVTEYIASGDAKGNKTYYEKADKAGKMEQFALPGFSAIDSLCQLVVGKGILTCASEKKTILLYDFTAKKDMPTDVDMLTDLVGKPVCAAVLHTIEDKRAKNDATGKYDATGQTYATNTVDKFLSPDERKTAVEVKNALDAAFAEQWLAKWKGQINDESSDVKSAGLKGAPEANGTDAPKTGLFG